ncbi:MAG: Serine-protein kinase RsbW [Candidatus Kapaibacterium sp.]|jgi:serine/threonine-protein kinase RsbW|nr:MAG: Serine-protein kinase RsbW [Candidatus Kapabacteria bacterium]ROL56372.1 MAG: ATP-binding protein [Bacteroidetes/Chlorobi group bacterium Naka2016]
MSSKETIEITKNFKTDKKILAEIETILKSIQKQFPFGDDKFHNILIATTEALINAIQHGNKFDPNKQVTLKITGNKELVQVVVQDEGEGFDPSTIPDPRSPDNILKERGRGIFLIRELSNSAQIITGKTGTTVIMNFYI